MRFPVLHSPLCTLHDPPTQYHGGRLEPYAESPDRVTAILDALLPSSSSQSSQKEPERFEECKFSWERDEVEDDERVIAAIRAVHGQAYIHHLRTIYEEWVRDGYSPVAAVPEAVNHGAVALEPVDPSKFTNASQKVGHYCYDLSAPITKDTWTAAFTAARLAVEGTTKLVNGTSSFVLCRPPGHHAGPELSGGFCFINNAAVAAREFQRLRPGSRVAILDVDCHHGNGTSAIFYSDPTVLYVSLHAFPDYPFWTGAESERGSGAGVGANINFPLPLGTGDKEYLETLQRAINEIKDWGTDVLIVSLGVDTFIEDPVTNMCITLEEGFSNIGRLIGETELPTLFLQEGGYCVPKIGLCVKAVLEGFISAKGSVC
ncbi:histone deacetylase superfamily protein [Meredithblackwellia eburnea MCA 4105]